MPLLRKPEPEEGSGTESSKPSDDLDHLPELHSLATDEPAEEQRPMRIGVLSDTHGHLDPRITEIFQGVDRILHAGDIGLPWLILELEQIAPVTAVTGNVDVGLEYKDTEIFECAGHKFLIHHIVDPESMDEKLEKRIIREGPDIVIYGHTHLRSVQTVNETLYFNPGYAGRKKADQERTVAILTCDPEGITADFFDLDA
ncbi:MAG TPA: metallophosphoesterase family protein [Methylomirabilota bacterium]|nr:metallophosphoesterase family protein [Methylomirabilota bacterium]